MAVVTYLTRLPLWLAATRRVPQHHVLTRVVEQIPVAAFAAIVFPGVLQPDGPTSIDATNLYLYAAAVTVAAGVALRGRLLATILVGITTAVVLRLLFG
jgi:branched-subunit amino acid transport protein